MTKGIAAIRLFLRELLLDKGAQGGSHGGLGLSRNADEHPVVEATPQYGGGPKNVGLLLLEPFDPKEDRLLDSRRQLEMADRLPIPPLGRLEDVTLVEGRFQELFEDERVAFGAGKEEIAQLVFDGRSVEDRAGHPANPGWIERWQQDGPDRARSLPCLNKRLKRVAPMEFVAAVGPKDEDSRAANATGEVVKQFAGGGVGPMEVFQDQEEPALLGRNLQQGKERLVQAHSRLTGVSDFDRRGGVELGKEVPQLTAGRGAESSLDPLAIRACQVIADSFDEWQIGQRQIGFGARPAHDRRACASGANPQGIDEACLTDSRLARDHHHLPAASVRRDEGILEKIQLARATDEDGAKRPFHGHSS